MSDEKKILEAVSETADMGRESISQAIPRSKDSGLRRALEAQKAEYDKNFEAARGLLRSFGEEPERAPAAAKAESWLTVGAKTVFSGDPTPRIAQMVIQGSTMGVTKITKELNEYRGGNSEVRALAEKELKTEQANIEQMKRFL